MHDINRRIKELRISRELSINRLASIIGVSPGNISDWESERKKSTPTAKALIALAQFFQVSLDWLMTGVESRPAAKSKPETNPSSELLRTISEHAETLPADDLQLLSLLAKRLVKPSPVISGEASYQDKDIARPGTDPKNLIRETSLSTDYFIKLPLVGRVTAGQPVTAVENIEEYFSVPKNSVSSQPHFILRIVGESMTKAGIQNNDLVIVRQQSVVDNGEIVVALIGDEEATVKTFYKEIDYIRLQPENDAMSPIIASDVRILGKVVRVLRDAN